MLRKFWFQLHWLIGISAGMILALMGTTGALLSFETDIIQLLNSNAISRPEVNATQLSPEGLIQQIQRQQPNKKLASLTRSPDSSQPARIQFAPEGKAKRGESRYVDPYTGQLLPSPIGQSFFKTVNQLHRNLLIPGWGKQITGVCAFCLIFLCLSGLYLRWPRHISQLKVWFSFSLKRRGRSLWWGIHSVLGTWALVVYLSSALTGLYWSYDWYRNWLRSLAEPAAQTQSQDKTQPKLSESAPAKATKPAGQSPAEAEPLVSQTGDKTNPNSDENRSAKSTEQAASAQPADSVLAQGELDQLWQQFEGQLGTYGYSTATLTLPQQAGAVLAFSYLDAQPEHERALNRLILAADASLLSHQRYQDQPLAKRLLGSMLPLHSGSFFGLTGQLLVFITSLGMPIFAITGWLMYLARRRNRRNRAQLISQQTNAERLYGSAASSRLSTDPL